MQGSLCCDIRRPGLCSGQEEKQTVLTRSKTGERKKDIPHTLFGCQPTELFVCPCVPMKQLLWWAVYIMLVYSLVNSQARFEKSEKSAWYPLFAHVVNFRTFREFWIIPCYFLCSVMLGTYVYTAEHLFVYIHC